MASWFAKRRPLVDMPRLKPRREQGAVRHVNLSNLSPQPVPFLGQVAYLKLDAFQALARAASEAPDLRVKESLAAAAERAIAVHRRLTGEISRQNAEPVEAMLPFVAGIDRFRETATGADWQEDALGVYVSNGLLDDFFVDFAAGLPGDVRARVVSILRSEDGMDGVVAVLEQATEADERLVSRFALWGRRLVGDTLLVARSALELSDGRDWDEERVEPVFTELMAAHTRRMDELGLTA